MADEVKQCGQSLVISPEIEEAVRELVEIAKKHGIISLDMKINPGWEGSFGKRLSHYGTIQVQWSRGRHGEKSGVTIRAELSGNVSV